MSETALHADPQPSTRRSLKIDVVSDVVCPWCYVGKRNLEAALAQCGEIDVVLHWRPYQLDPTIPQRGYERHAYMARKFGAERVPAIQTRIAEAARETGLDLAFDRIRRSPNTLDAHRVIRWAWAAGQQDAVVESLFRAFFVEGEDIGDRAVLVAHAERAGLDGAVVRRLLDEEADADVVRAEIDQAKELGVTGVPFFILDGRIGLSGAQPPEVLLRAMEQALQPHASDA